MALLQLTKLWFEYHIRANCKQAVTSKTLPSLLNWISNSINSDATLTLRNHFNLLEWK